jgi:ABC-type polysaccharide/polyol phosphate export permease
MFAIPAYLTRYDRTDIGYSTERETMSAIAVTRQTSGSPDMVWRLLANLRKGLLWAWLDVVCQYRRSKIGPLWETINVVVMILGLTVVSSAILGGDVANLIGYIGLGIIIWSAISALIIEGTTAFIKNASLITTSNIDLDLYVGRTVFRILINFSHHFILYFIAVALMIVPLGWTSLLAVPGIILLFANGFWVVTVLAFICSRFRDVELIVRNLLQLAFFVTPVFWSYQQIAGNRKFIVDYNIIFYFIEIIRAPLLGQIPPLRDYLVIAAVTAFGYVLALLVYRRMRRQLAFFV